MGTRKIREGADRVYEAAQAWVDAALRSDSSLFTPGEAIWSSRWLKELREHFLDRPDVSGGKFLEKLQQQLAGRPPQVHLLMAEALYFHRLIVSTWDDTHKRRSIETVLGWFAIPGRHPCGAGPEPHPRHREPGPVFPREAAQSGWLPARVRGAMEGTRRQ